MMLRPVEHAIHDFLGSVGELAEGPLEIDVAAE
jgi:hypothetical protein